MNRIDVPPCENKQLLRLNTTLDDILIRDTKLIRQVLILYFTLRTFDGILTVNIVKNNPILISLNNASNI